MTPPTPETARNPIDPMTARYPIPREPQAVAVIVMGVSGAGKSTVAAAPAPPASDENATVVDIDMPVTAIVTSLSSRLARMVTATDGHAGPFVPYKELSANIGFTGEMDRAAAPATPKE